MKGVQSLTKTRAGRETAFGVGATDLPEGFTVIVVGDGAEEEAAAERLDLDFVKVRRGADLGVAAKWIGGAGQG